MHFLALDRIEITLTVLEEKNGSDFEDFSEVEYIHTAEEKSSKDESIFPSRTVKVISIRSLMGITAEPQRALSKTQRFFEEKTQAWRSLRLRGYPRLLGFMSFLSLNKYILYKI